MIDRDVLKKTIRNLALFWGFVLILVTSFFLAGDDYAIYVFMFWSLGSVFVFSAFGFWAIEERAKMRRKMYEENKKH